MSRSQGAVASPIVSGIPPDERSIPKRVLSSRAQSSRWYSSRNPSSSSQTPFLKNTFIAFIEFPPPIPPMPPMPPLIPPMILLISKPGLFGCPLLIIFGGNLSGRPRFSKPGISFKLTLAPSSKPSEPEGPAEVTLVVGFVFLFFPRVAQAASSSSSLYSFASFFKSMFFRAPRQVNASEASANNFKNLDGMGRARMFALDALLDVRHEQMFAIGMLLFAETLSPCAGLLRGLTITKA
mmetsp:Transcript_69224/g.156473  ORF Transcript_69224/g.156473 Transcript_69224/m.156473 type:complete len:238 (+) Transcript_69224:607-1320(+)